MKAAQVKWIKIGSIFFFVLVILLVSKPLPATAADTIKIGLADAYSGPFEFAGRMYLSGIQFAVDEQNAKGGLLGKKIEIVKEDSEYKADVAVRKFKKLIVDEKVDILGAGTNSATAIVMNKAATENKKIAINYGGMSDVVQGKEFSRYSFRVVQQMYNIWAGFSAFLADKPYRRFYFVGQDMVAGYDAAKVFKEHVKRRLPDAVIVGEDFHPLATKDFAPYITKIIAAKPDLVALQSTPPDLNNFIKQARALGLKKPFPFFSMSAGEPYVLNDLKDDAIGLIFVGSYSMNVNTPENQAMIKRYHEKHKNDKDFLTWWPFHFIGAPIVGWKAFFAAIEKAGSLDAEKIIQAFEDFQWKTPLGTTYTMRKCDHQMILPMYASIIDNPSNPYYNGSIRPDVKFPFEGTLKMLPASEVAFPATPDHNPRCR